MKKLILLIAAIFTLSVANAQIKSSVDERFELTSIVFRLAGAPEYSMCGVPSYAKDIDDYFAPYKEHELIPFLQELREHTGVSYNAVSSATPYLEIKNGSVRIKKGCDPSELYKIDTRWNEANFKTFVKYLNDFYKKSKFNTFYTNHADTYKKATESLDGLLATLNLDWCESFFGEKKDEVVVFASLTNGSSNYSLSLPDNPDAVTILLGAHSNQEGSPQYYPFSTTTIVHEIFHHYSGTVFEPYWDKVKEAADKIYSHVSEKMLANGYGDARAVFYEWFDNLCMLMYFRDNTNADLPLDHLIAYTENFGGYIWMGRSCLFMEHFYEHRDKYKTINDYMPQLVAFVNYTADNYDKVQAEYEAKIPYLVDAFPASGSSISIDDIDTLEYRFSVPMYGNQGVGGRFGDIPTLPVLFNQMRWKDNQTIIIPIDKSKIEKGVTYKLGFFPASSKLGYNLKQPYEHTITIAE
jgi:hypothetical protein